MSAIYINWAEDSDFFDLGCPNTIHHIKYGFDWATAHGSTTDLAGNKCSPYQGCKICDEDSGQVEPIYNYAHIAALSNYTAETRCEIAHKTDCVLVRKTSGPTDEWYIALTGCGFDATPDIAAAYLIADNAIPSYILLDLNYNYCKKTLSAELCRGIEDEIKEVLKQHKVQAQRWIDAKKKLEVTT